jgi:hypothetical protein
VLKKQISNRGDWGTSKQRVLYSINGLPDGPHNVRISVVSGNVALDSFAVLDKPVMDHNAQLLVVQNWWWPALNWGSDYGTPVTLANGNSGSATIRLTDTDNYIKNTVAFEFVAVADIVSAPELVMAGSSQVISATVEPENATRKDIVWSVKKAGDTGAQIIGNTLKTTAPGVIVVTAAVEDGLGLGKNYVKDFTIEVKENVALASLGGTMYTGPGTFTQAGQPVSNLNNGTTGPRPDYWTNFGSGSAPHYSDYLNDAIVGVTLGQAYNVDALELFIINDGGGCFPPTRVIVQYWDGEAYVNVTGQSRTTGFAGDWSGGVGNAIKFDPVFTNDIRVIMTHDLVGGIGRAIGLSEFAVYSVSSGSVTPPEVKTIDILEKTVTINKVKTDGTVAPLLITLKEETEEPIPADIIKDVKFFDKKGVELTQFSAVVNSSGQSIEIKADFGASTGSVTNVTIKFLTVSEALKPAEDQVWIEAENKIKLKVTEEYPKITIGSVNQLNVVYDGPLSLTTERVATADDGSKVTITGIAFDGKDSGVISIGSDGKTITALAKGNQKLLVTVLLDGYHQSNKKGEPEAYKIKVIDKK